MNDETLIIVPRPNSPSRKNNDAFYSFMPFNTDSIKILNKPFISISIIKNYISNNIFTISYSTYIHIKNLKTPIHYLDISKHKKYIEYSQSCNNIIAFDNIEHDIHNNDKTYHIIFGNHDLPISNLTYRQACNFSDTIIGTQNKKSVLYKALDNIVKNNTKISSSIHNHIFDFYSYLLKPKHKKIFNIPINPIYNRRTELYFQLPYDINLDFEPYDHTHSYKNIFHQATESNFCFY